MGRVAHCSEVRVIYCSIAWSSRCDRGQPPLISPPREPTGHRIGSLVHRDTEVVALPPLLAESAIHLLIVPIKHFETLTELLNVAPQLAGTATQVAGGLRPSGG